MNLEKLFEMQQMLRDKINYFEPDRFEKLILAFLVESGECANEWRGFKFWSTNQKPCTFMLIPNANMDTRTMESRNPLLEEYVDKLHFALEIGLQLGITKFDVWVHKEATITDQYIEIMGVAYSLYQTKMKAFEEVSVAQYEHLFGLVLGLAEMLGFTWDQIEQAYLDKNKVNHERQENGY